MILNPGDRITVSATLTWANLDSSTPNDAYVEMRINTDDIPNGYTIRDFVFVQDGNSTFLYFSRENLVQGTVAGYDINGTGPAGEDIILIIRFKLDFLSTVSYVNDLDFYVAERNSTTYNYAIAFDNTFIDEESGVIRYTTPTLTSPITYSLIDKANVPIAVTLNKK